MKTSVIFFAASLFFTTAVRSQSQATVFEDASAAKGPSGEPCILLSWKKGAENTAFYLVERSTNGKTFQQVALVFPAEDATFCQYAFRDQVAAPNGTEVYYRLAMVNGQKEITYLPVKKAVFSTGLPEQQRSSSGAEPTNR